MVRTNAINRTSRMKLKQYFMVFMLFMMTFSGMVPSTTLMGVQALEGTTLEKPNVSKDVDGESKKEITKGEEFNYNVKVSLPEDISGYETMTILDNLDEHLAIQSTQILIDEEVDDTLKADVKDQKVELSMTQEELETLAGKEVQLQITTQIKDDAAHEGEIENVAEIVINEDMDFKTDPAIVTLIELDESEEVDMVDTEKPKEVVVEETDESETPVSDNAESRKSEKVVADEEKEESRAFQPMNDGSFDINNTDSYGTSSGTTFDRIYQFDGNDPTIVKGFIQVTGLPANLTNLNALAVSKDGYLYARGNINSVNRLYEIDGTGQARHVTNIQPTVNATMHGDRYYYIFYNNQNNSFLEYVNVKTGETGRTQLKNNTGQPLANLGADMVVDADGYIWVTQRNTIVQINPSTSEILRVVPVPGLDNVESNVRGLSFLPSGDMLVSTGNENNRPFFYTISQDGNLTPLGRMMNLPPNYMGDLGSAVTPYFDPFPPILESDKNVTLLEKMEGNTDVDNPEVGDTLKYTIQTRNTVENYSVIKDLVITDTIPEGLTYVAGSLEVDGESVTDASDDDAGHVVDGKVTGTFGDITDTEAHTVTFLVTVDEGQAGKDIKNIAVVDSDNHDPDEPEEDVKIYPRAPKLASEKLAENLEADKDGFEVGDTVVYTIQTRNTVTDSLVENLVITDELPEGLEFVEGSLSVSHDGEATFTDGVVTATFEDVEDTEWRSVTFEVKIESGQSGQTIENVATVEGEDIPPTHPGTEIIVDPKGPKLESNKSSTLETKADGNTDADNPEVGDTIRYTIQTKNTIEDSLIKNLVITDTIPEGLTYVAGSLEVDGESVTDASDDDAGHVVDGKVTGTFGDITDTEAHTVTFLVTVDEGQAGKDIKNIAVVDSDNHDPDEPEEDVKIYPRAPKLESEKLAVNLDKDKKKYEVGDTVVYTIKTRNTVSDSIIKNLMITDNLPDGLEYVEGSLELSHEGTGKFKDGTIIANFGDVKDTEWRTITFQVKILSNQFGKTIKNVATVNADNVPEPNHPEEKIVVEQKDSLTPVPDKTEPPVDDQKDGVKVPSTDKKEEGKLLPNTATNIFNYLLFGMIALFVGLLTLRRQKSSAK